METPCSHKGNRVLLVEGKNDCHVILALCKHFNLPNNFEIFQCGNDTGVIEHAEALLLQSSTECIGIVLDADEGTALDYRWRQIRQSDLSLYGMPDTPDPKGTILSPRGKPRLGIWIMPNNVLQGRLEDFLMEMAPPEAIEQARQCVAMAQENQVTTFKPVHISKAHLHTYLAWQDEPGSPMGRSITTHALDPRTPTAQDFVTWLQRLFSPAADEGNSVPA